MHTYIKNFSKNDSNLIKGIAILVMVYYHAIALSGKSNFWILGAAMSRLGNICVPMFAFISTYGISKYLESNNLSCYQLGKMILFRIKKIYKSYLPAFFFGFVLTALLDFMCNLIFSTDYATIPNAYGNGLQGFWHFIVNMLGLSHLFYGSFNYTLNQTWWYIALAILIVITTPIIYQFTRNSKKRFLFCVILWGIVAIGTRNTYVQYIFIILIAIFVSRSENFAKISRKSILMHCAILSLWIGYRGLFNDTWSVFWNCAAAYTVIVLAKFTLEYFNMPNVERFLLFMGQHSANIFYLHSFVYYYWIPSASLVNKLKIGILIYAATLAITIALSYTLDFFKGVLSKTLYRF